MSLSETQILVLSRAANREGGFVLPVPEGCRAKGGAVDKVIAGLVRRGWATTIKGRYLREVPDGVGSWRSEGGEPLYPVITRAGLEAIGVVEPEDAGEAEAETAPDAEGQDEPAEGVQPVDAEADATSEPAQEPAPTRRTSRAAGIARRRLAAAKNALETVCGHWADTGRLDEPLLGACRAALEEIGRADAALEAEAPSVQAGEPRAGPPGGASGGRTPAGETPMKLIRVSDATYRMVAEMAILPFRSTGMPPATPCLAGWSTVAREASSRRRGTPCVSVVESARRLSLVGRGEY